MHGIIAQQMRVGFHRAQIVQRHHFDVAAPAFHDGAQHKTPDAAKAVDRNADCHVFSPT